MIRQKKMHRDHAHTVLNRVLCASFAALRHHVPGAHITPDPVCSWRLLSRSYLCALLNYRPNYQKASGELLHPVELLRMIELLRTVELMNQGELSNRRTIVL